MNICFLVFFKDLQTFNKSNISLNFDNNLIDLLLKFCKYSNKRFKDLF